MNRTDNRRSGSLLIDEEVVVPAVGDAYPRSIYSVNSCLASGYKKVRGKLTALFSSYFVYDPPDLLVDGKSQCLFYEVFLVEVVDLD